MVRNILNALGHKQQPTTEIIDSSTASSFELNWIFFIEMIVLFYLLLLIPLPLPLPLPLQIK